MKQICTLVLCIQTVCLNAQLYQNLEEVFDNHDLMGMSVVRICGDIGESYHFGAKDYTRQLDVDDSTMYRIASISKTVTAMGLMKLYEEGAFELDDDVSTALGFELRNPDFPDVPITYRMLLSHQSSIQDGTGYNGFLEATYSFDATPPSIDQLLTQAGGHYTADMFRNEEPGTYFAYSNINYGIIGTLIEALSGQRFDIYMREQILEPLQIAGSYNVADIANIDNVAVLYRYQGGWNPQADNFQGEQPIPLLLQAYQTGTNGLIFAPQGGLRISPSDLARIMITFQSGSWNGVSVLESETIELMKSVQWLYDGTNGDNYYGLFRSWGLGLHITTDTPMGDRICPGSTFIGHPGEAYGLISDMYWFPDAETEAGFIFMTNGSANGFEFGLNSAYYTLEEEVFEALCASFSDDCFLDMTDPETSDVLVWPNPGNGYIHIRGISTQHPPRFINALGMSCQPEISLIASDELVFDSSAMDAGIYCVEVVSIRGTKIRIPVAVL